MENIYLIKACQLSVSPDNARRTRSKNLDDIKPSILAHGLIQNLTVTQRKDDEKLYHVVSGSRRLAAIHALQAEGKLAGDYEAPCFVIEHDQAREISLAENIIRQAMHPADEFEAFSALADTLSADQIADHFGVSEKHVLQRMKLGRIAPELIDEYRSGKLNLDALEAFAITDDHKKQQQVYKALPEWQKGSGHHIRSRLTDKMTSSATPLGRFVGKEEYLKKGGKGSEDLFGNVFYFHDAALLGEIADRKLSASRDLLLADGWGWVEISKEQHYAPNHSYLAGFSTIEPVAGDVPQALLEAKEALQKKYEEIDERYHETDDDELEDQLLTEMNAIEEQQEALEAQIAATARFDKEKMEHAGCYICLSDKGGIEIHYGLLAGKDKKRVQAIDLRTKDEQEKPAPAASAQPTGLSQSAIDALGYERLQVAQLAIAGDNNVALTLLTLQLYLKLFKSGFYGGININPSKTGLPFGMKPNGAGKAFADAHGQLRLEWDKEKSYAAKFHALHALPVSDRMDILSYCTAACLPARLCSTPADKQCPIEAALSAQEKVQVHEHWRPTVDNHLGRMTRDMLLALGKALFGKDWAENNKGSKKAELTDSLHNAFARPDDHGASVAEKLRAWLPDGMAFLPAEKSPAKKKTAKADKEAA